MSVGDFSSQHWYAMRRAGDAALVFAAFADLGPTVSPKTTAPPDAWLAPLSIELGPFACAPEDLGSCTANAPQRAVAHVLHEGQGMDVVGGTLADVGDYRVHLGFAGTPEVCEGSPSQFPLEGLVFLRPDSE